MKNMLNLLILFVICLIGTRVNCQNDVPNRIVVQYYLGGDYNDSEIRGVIEDVYKVEYDYDQNSKLFTSKYLNHKHQVYNWDERNTDNYRLIEDSTVVIYDEISIDKEKVLELIEYADRDKYEEKELIEIQDVPFPLIDTAIVIKDFSLEDMGINSSYFIEACSLYRKILMNEEPYLFEKIRPCDWDIDFSEITDNFISQSHSDWNISSYSIWVKVQLDYENGNEIIITQDYPGGFNTGWNIEMGDFSFKAINPRINRIISNFMHSRYTQLDQRLLRFQDLKQLVRFYLMNN